MAKGYGIQVGDVVLVALLAVGGILAWKFLKPVSQVEQSTADIYSGFSNLWQTQTSGFAGLLDVFWNKTSSLFTGNQNQPVNYYDQRTITAEKLSSYNSGLQEGTRQAEFKQAHPLYSMSTTKVPPPYSVEGYNKMVYSKIMPNASQASAIQKNVLTALNAKINAYGTPLL